MSSRTSTPKATGWVMGTVALTAAMGAGSWFLGIGPVVEEAGEARTQAQSVVHANELQEVKIDRLRTQFESLHEYKAELAGLQAQIPTDAELPEYYRELAAIAAQRGVTVTSISADLGMPVVPAVPAAPAAAVPAEDASTTETSADGSGDATAQEPQQPVAPVVPPGFVAIPMTITVVGPYENVVGFMEAAQTGTSRLFLVAGYSGTAQNEGEASAGKPATTVGDLEISVNGYIYVLEDDVLSVETPMEGQSARAPLPGAIPGKNPLIPIGGAS